MISTYTIRPFVWSDMAAVVEVMRARAQARGMDASFTVEAVEARWRAPYNHPDRDCFVAVLDDGRLVGFGIADMPEDSPGDANGVLRVLPDAEPLVGRALVEQINRHYRACAPAGPAAITYDVSAQAGETIALLEALGLHEVRRFYTMRIALDGPVTPLPVPAGFTVRPFDIERDARAAYDAQHDAFVDHWRYHQANFEDWLYDARKPGYHPIHWWIALDGEEVAGLALSEPISETRANIGIVGVRPAWRRRGLALVLLNRCFAAHQAQGRHAVELGVDVENAHQALSVYQRAGMTIADCTVFLSTTL